MSPRLLWLPDVLAGAGLKVAPQPGWESRGLDAMGPIRGVICHYTGTVDPKRHVMPTLQLLIDGRSDLSGPLAQLGLGRDGTYFVIASGKANHAGRGAWNGVETGNSNFVGIEAENSGRADDPWPAAQVDAYHRGVAAILAFAGRTAASCCGHREWALPAGRKSDPNLDMDTFRQRVTAILAGDAPPPPLIPPEEPSGQKRPTLRRGDADGEFVRLLQAKLGIAPPGPFGPKTEAAVREFQRAHGMLPDGIVGPKTWAAVDAAPAR